MRFKGLIKKWLYGSVPGFAGRFPYFGTYVYFPKNSYVFDLACADGIYESGVLRIIWQLVEAHSYYFDVGANIGLLSVPVLKAKPTCQVVSFEPSPNSLPYLLRTVNGSPYKNRWTVRGQAVGATCGDVSFCVNDPSQGAFDGLHDNKRAEAKESVTVPMTTIDTVWQEIGTPKVSMIKIDVEGFETEVLKGALKCLDHNKPFIILEWNPTNLEENHIDYYSLIDLAHSVGYSVFSSLSLQPIVNRASLHLQMSLQVGEFLLGPDSSPVTPNTSRQELVGYVSGN